MADFLTTYNKYIKPNEGYYSNTKNDLGGVTYGGISRVYNPIWNGWKILDAYVTAKGGISKMNWNEHITALDQPVQDFYQNLWKNTDMDLIKSQDIANQLFDWIVNSGEGTAIKHLQGLLNITQDGSIGPMTVAAINKADSSKLNNALKLDRLQFISNIVKNDPSQSDFLNTWVARVNKFPTLTVVGGGALIALVAFGVVIYLTSQNS